MTLCIAELNEEFRRIHKTCEHAGVESRKVEVEELHSMLEQLWHLQSLEAVGFRRLVRAMTEQSAHAVRPHHERTQALQHHRFRLAKS